MSTTSTPVKMTGGAERVGGGDTLEGTTAMGEGDSTDGSEGGEARRVSSTELGSYKGSIANLRDLEETLPDNLYPSSSDANLGKRHVFYLRKNSDNSQKYEVLSFGYLQQ